MHQAIALVFSLLPASLMSALAFASSPFDGTWKADLHTLQLPTKPDRYLLKDGSYHCQSCVPPWSIKADGQDHKVTGQPYFDTASARIIDDHSVEEIDKKAGKAVITIRMTVSPDGQLLSAETVDSSASSGAPVTTRQESRRVAQGPPHSHAVSGGWRVTRLESVSDNGLLTTYIMDGRTLKMSNPLGQAYAAPLNGGDSPYVGDPGITSVSIKRIDEHTLEERDKRGGEVIYILRMTVAADGKTMKVIFRDKLHGTRGAYTNIKQ